MRSNFRRSGRLCGHALLHATKQKQIKRRLNHLHKTAVAWMRVRLAQTAPQEGWTEACEEYGARLKAACESINKELDVEGLC